MIPKIIHFCWFGGNPLPPLALECIASWRKYLPDYEIWMWTEEGGLTSNLKLDKVMTFDVNSIPYTAEAYRQKKYAYVSDYCRFAVMYEYGGIYFDTDVEVIRSMDDIIAKGCFMGFEQNPDGENTPGRYAPRYSFAVNPGLGFGITSKHPFIERMIEYYRTLTFEPIPTGDIAWYKTVVAYTTEMLMQQIPALKNELGIQLVGDDIYVYPSEYFAPINAISRRLHITKNTHTIHRYMASWSEQKSKSWMDYVKHYLPECIYFLNNKIKRRNYRIR